MNDQAQADCFHCGLPVPSGSAYEVEVDGKPQPMCCPGCRAVAQAIVDNGLTDFYRYRTGQKRGAELVPESLRELELYDRPELQRTFVREVQGAQREAALILEGIVCAACVWLNERHVSALPGVKSFRVNYATHRASLVWDDSRIHLSDILKAIAGIGYVAHPFDPGRQEQLQQRERAAALRRLAIAGLGAMQVMMLAIAMYAGDYSGMDDDLRQFMRWISLIIATPVLLYSAQPFFASAWRDLRRRTLGMDVPVALAIGAAYGASAWATASGGGAVYFDSATMFTFFLLAGRFLEMSARHRAGQAAEELIRLLPATATRVLDDGGSEVVSAAELRPGDRVLIRPGETVPADGAVIEGRSSVDESLLTGESMPRTRGPGDKIVGGTVNVDSPLHVAVEQVGVDTVLSSIVRLLDRAQSEKPRIALLADRVAAWFVLALLVLAAAVFGWWWLHRPEDAFWIMLSVLVVTCPCALSLATPAALTAATGRLTRMGVLTTRGHALETLARATHMIFDKTGTLTYGRPRLLEVKPLGSVDRGQLLRLGAALEKGSEHPLAKALRDAAPDAPSATALAAIPGMGMEGTVDSRRYRIGKPEYAIGLSAEPAGTPAPPGSDELTWIALGTGNGLLGWFGLADQLRPDALQSIAALRDLGLQLVLLSGDAPQVVERVAAELGIAQAHGSLLPAEKLAYVRGLQNQGATVAMVGDGVNDAPVLAGAQVSLAMGGGTQLAHASADMVLLSEQLPQIAAGVRMARRTVNVIGQNLAWAVLYNGVAVPLAAAGWVAPWMAALGMSLSSLVVVVNALRLAGEGSEPQQPAANLPSPSAAP